MIGASLKSDSTESRYDCNDHGDKCNFKDDVTNSNFKGKVAEDDVRGYLFDGPESNYHETPFENYKNDDLGKFKVKLYETAKDVFGDKKDTLALVAAMAMIETNGIRGWDKTKDDDNDGSANFGIFNMNEDFLNSIRHDLNKAGKKDPFVYRDSKDRGKSYWFEKFNYTKKVATKTNDYT